jgi:hypothetical protein
MNNKKVSSAYNVPQGMSMDIDDTLRNVKTLMKDLKDVRLLETHIRKLREMRGNGTAWEAEILDPAIERYESSLEHFRDLMKYR